MVAWRIAIWAVIVLAALGFLYLVRGILMPFILAILLSVILDPAVRKLRFRGMSRPAAVFSVMGVFLVIAIGALILIVPTVVGQVSNLTGTINNFVRDFNAESGNSNFFVRWNPEVKSRRTSASETVDKFFASNRGLLQTFHQPTSRAEFINRYVEPNQGEISHLLESSFTDMLGFLTNFGSKALLLLFTPIFTLLILLDLERFRQRSANLIPPSIRKDTMRLMADIGDVFGKYLRGVATVLTYYFIVATVVLTVLHAPYSILLALLFALIYLVPFLGPIINAGVLILITMLSGNTSCIFFSAPSPLTFAATITIIFAVIMFGFDQLVYARVVGRSVGLHPVVSFFVVFSGAALFGAVGMILAFPVAGSAKVILDRMFRFTSKDGDDSLDLPSVPLRHRATVQG